MARIADLVSELRPAGVEYRALGELLDYEQPGKYLVASTAYDPSYETPVLTAGQTFVLGHTDETEGIYPASADAPVVIFDDFTTASKWVDFPFKAKSSAMKMLTPKTGVEFEFRYVFFAMQAIPYRPHNHARQWIRNFSTFKIPLPPIDVQREIVGVLDDFARLEDSLRASLSAESQARQLQHAHYRREILGLSGAAEDEPLDELVEFTNGKAHERLVVPDGSVALLTARFISTSGRMARWVDASDALTPAVTGDIAMVMSDLPNGRALARCFYVEADGKYSANQRVCLLRVRDPGKLSARWLYHVLERNPQLLAYDNGQDQTHLKKGQILSIRIPTVPLAEQERAVASLDRLDAATRALMASLDTEREGRRRQYEFYRDRLLAFDEVAA